MVGLNFYHMNETILHGVQLNVKIYLLSKCLCVWINK